MISCFERLVLKWSVQAICYTHTVTVIRSEHLQTKATSKSQAPGKIIIYKKRFESLLSVEKPLRDQLIIEFPTLNGLRTTEVATIRISDVDVENGDLTVLDSKKHVYITEPLNSKLGKHCIQYIQQLADQGITEGYLIRWVYQNGKIPSTNKSLTTVAIEQIWRKWCKTADIPYMTPRYGRAYFAVNWHVVKKKSLIGLMQLLRHESLDATHYYLSRIYCYEDLKSEFQQGEEDTFNLAQCGRFSLCPNAVEGCRCRGFQPQISKEVEA